MTAKTLKDIHTFSELSAMLDSMGAIVVTLTDAYTDLDMFGEAGMCAVITSIKPDEGELEVTLDYLTFDAINRSVAKPLYFSVSGEPNLTAYERGANEAFEEVYFDPLDSFEAYFTLEGDLASYKRWVESGSSLSYAVWLKASMQTEDDARKEALELLMLVNAHKWSVIAKDDKWFITSKGTVISEAKDLKEALILAKAARV